MDQQTEIYVFQLLFIVTIYNRVQSFVIFYQVWRNIEEMGTWNIIRLLTALELSPWILLEPPKSQFKIRTDGVDVPPLPHPPGYVLVGHSHFSVLKHSRSPITVKIWSLPVVSALLPFLPSLVSERNLAHLLVQDPYKFSPRI